MIKNAVNQQSPGKQLLLFVLLFGGIFIVFNIIGLVLITQLYNPNLIRDMSSYNFTSPVMPAALYTLQIIAMTVPLFVTSYVFARFIVNRTDEYLKPSFRFNWLLLIIAFFVMMTSAPLIEGLSNINQQLALPKWLSWLEEWMKNSEEQAQLLTKAILKMGTVGDMLKNLLLIGLLTAIVEELMFRGVLQTIMQRWTKNTHSAIWITAALFSAFHLEFYGFLPRMLLGGLFGYFVAWSGSIWPAVWGHFLNNGTAVVVTYLYQHKKIKLNPDDTHAFSYPGYIFSVIIVIILLLVYKNIASGKKQAVEINGEELG